MALNSQHLKNSMLKFGAPCEKNKKKKKKVEKRDLILALNSQHSKVQRQSLESQTKK